MNANQVNSDKKRSLVSALMTGAIVAVLCVAGWLLLIKPNYVKKQNEMLTENTKLQSELEQQKLENEKQYKKVKEQYELEKNRNEKLMVANQSVQKELKKCQGNINICDKKLKSKTKELTECSEKLGDLDKEKDQLLSQIDEISKENASLKEEAQIVRSEESSPVIVKRPQISKKKPAAGTQNISGSEIIIHYTKDCEQNVNSIQEKLKEYNANITLKQITKGKYDKKNKCIYHFPGSSSVKAAEQIKTVLDPIVEICVEKSKFWFIFQNKDRLDLWLTEI
ncbi:hypothetical protein JW835_06165 [bacterium]|nr:hypothetical protein [bacterium]